MVLEKKFQAENRNQKNEINGKKKRSDGIKNVTVMHGTIGKIKKNVSLNGWKIWNESRHLLARATETVVDGIFAQRDRMTL